MMTFRTIFGVFVGLALAAASVGLFAWLLWWLWSRRQEEDTTLIEIEVDEPPVAEIEIEATETRAAEVEIEAEKVEAEEAASTEEEAVEPDDLKVIEGIGPKLASVLQEAGIVTYTQLAEAEVSQIEGILEAADPRLLRLAKPTTWPEQAALAAAGQWEALEALQGELKGGRRG